jgi:hypothetical protein
MSFAGVGKDVAGAPSRTMTWGRPVLDGSIFSAAGIIVRCDKTAFVIAARDVETAQPETGIAQLRQT